MAARSSFGVEFEALRRSITLLSTVAGHAPARLRAALLEAIEELETHAAALGASGSPEGIEALEEENERLRAQIAGKDVLLGAVAHELRAPLAAVLGYALTLERGTLVSEEERAVVVSRLAERARSLSLVVDDLLDLDLFARGVLTLRRERVDLRALVRDALDHARVGGRRVDILGGSIEAMLDRPRALRMIRALIEAAAGLTPAPLHLTLEEDEQTVSVSVTTDPDEGAESAAPERARLALTLAATLAQIHAGRVAVTPREDGAVWLRLEVPRGG